MMTAAEFRSWVSGLADCGAVLPASEVLTRLPEADEQESPPAEPSPLEMTWRERLWLVPAETRLGVHEVCEALDRSQSWAYRRTGAKAKDPLPHRLMDGQLVFVAGELRTWIRENEVSIHELPMDSTPSERTLKVMGA